MSTLFEIVNEFQELYELATDPEVDPDVFADTLEALTGELEVKSKGYVSVIKQLEMEMTQANIVAEQFKAKAKVRENHIKQMKEALKTAMTAIGTDMVEAGDWTIKIKKNGGVQPLVITGEVPDNMMKVIVEPDNTKIREYLKDNKAEWAHLEPRGTHVEIK
jgi:hypothetical protein